MDPLRPGDPDQVGPYRLEGRLGAGGMGQVFLGRSRGGLRVVVKVIHPEHAGDNEYRARFAREAEAARRVGGFYTAQVVDADPRADPPWMATAYIPGPSLREAIRDRGPLDSDSVRALAAGLAEGLAAIHARGMVHRDLKPANIILAADGPRIIDFGIARPVDISAVTRTGAAVGTPSYMSPEQVEGLRVGPASDVFSLGTVVVHAITGTSPFAADSAPAIARRILGPVPALDEVPAELRPLIRACWAQDPDQRPTPAELLTQLGTTHSGNWPPPHLADLTTEPSDPSTLPPAQLAPPPRDPLDAARAGPPDRPDRDERRLTPRTLLSRGVLSVLAAGAAVVAVVALASDGRDADPPARGSAASGEKTAPYDPADLRLVSDAVGTFSPALERDIARLWSESLDGVTSAAVDQDGTVASRVRQLDEGMADLALSHSITMASAVQGQDQWAADPLANPGEIRTLGNVYPRVVHLVTTADSGIETAADLAGARVRVSVTAYSSFVGVAREILASHGVDMDADLQGDPVYEGTPQSWDMLGDDSLDAMFVVSDFPISALDEQAEDTNLVLLDISGAARDQLLADNAAVAAFEIPGGTYPGQEEPVETVNVPQTLFATSDLDERLAYDLARVLHEETGQIDHELADQIELGTAVDALGPVPLHTGAQRYFEETGVL